MPAAKLQKKHRNLKVTLKRKQKVEKIENDVIEEKENEEAEEEEKEEKSDTPKSKKKERPLSAPEGDRWLNLYNDVMKRVRSLGQRFSQWRRRISNVSHDHFVNVSLPSLKRSQSFSGIRNRQNTKAKSNYSTEFLDRSVSVDASGADSITTESNDDDPDHTPDMGASQEKFRKKHKGKRTFLKTSFRFRKSSSKVNETFTEESIDIQESFDTFQEHSNPRTSTPSDSSRLGNDYTHTEELSESGTSGGRDGEEDQRSQNSLDGRPEEAAVEGESPQQVSRSKKMWNSFKKSAQKFRSRSREKGKNKNKDDANRLSQSQPDISQDPENPENKEFDQLFNDTDKLNGEHGDEDGGQNSAERNDVAKESEVDSGIAVVENKHRAKKETSGRNKESVFRQYPFFQLDVHLKEGHDLVIRDSCGTSDPYVKFKIGSKQYYKSRIIQKNLNPRWDEKFNLPIEDPFKPVQLKVFDYDRGLNDDPMGGAEILPTSLEINKPQDLKLKLTEKTGKDKNKYMGYLTLTVTLQPKSQDEKEQYFKRNVKAGDQVKKFKTQIWSSVVTIVLVEGRDLLPMDDNGFSDPYVKFRLGNEKYKSKYKAKTLNPTWLEQFDLHMFDDQTSHLEISVWDHDTAGKDDIMGRAVIDLSSLAREETHSLEQPLEDGAGFIKMMLTISGTSGGESISDLSNFVPNPRERENVIRKYGLKNSFKNIKDVGWLQVKVIKAQNLAAADIGGKSDPYCVLELVNARLQTQTEYKTLSPEWGKVFTFNVKDVHSVLEVTVYDEDRDKKAEFLGKVAIPILRIRSGERRWFALKDKKLISRVKGSIMIELDFVYNHMRRKERRWYQLKDKKVMGRAKGAIMLEMDFNFNHVKAAIRTFNPREEKYMQPDPKFKIAIMKRNIDRVSKIAEAGVESGKFIQSCFDWESKPRSITAFIVFLILVWNFELYMLPITLLIVFFKNLLVVHIVGNLMKDKDEDEYVDEEDDDDEEEKDKEEKKSFKEKLQAVQEVCLQVQEGMDMVASMGERVKNTANWTVPWLSWLAVIIFTIGTFVLYYVPIRYLILAWGVNKFTKKLRAPNAIQNNELLDYLSRVPSDKELIMYRELRPDPGVGTAKKKRTST